MIVQGEKNVSLLLNYTKREFMSEKKSKSRKRILWKQY